MRSDGRLHVSMQANSARLRSPRNRALPLTRERRYGVTLHWDDGSVRRRGTAARVDLQDALLAFVSDARFEEAVAVLDWATHTGRLDLFRLEELILRLPHRLQGIRAWIDPNCESYPESITRTRLRLRGFRVTSQVSLASRERIDLVVEGHVAIEVDGEEFHRDRFHQDRQKDLRVTLTGRHALRITVRMLLETWPDVEAAVTCSLTARGWAGAPSILRPALRPSLQGTAVLGRRRMGRMPTLPA